MAATAEIEVAWPKVTHVKFMGTATPLSGEAKRAEGTPPALDRSALDGFLTRGAKGRIAAKRDTRRRLMWRNEFRALTD